VTSAATAAADTHTASASHGPVIASGQCRVLYAFDVGLAIDLDACRRMVVEAGTDEWVRRRGSPSYFAYHPPPLRIQDVARELVPGTPRSGIEASRGEVAITLYDFGAVTVEYNYPLSGPLAGLLPLSRELDGNVTLQQDAAGRTARVLERIRSAVTRFELQSAVEDYVIFQVDRFDRPTDAQSLLAAHAPLLAAILRAEAGPLDAAEVEEVLRNRLIYGTSDLVIIDWNSAFVFDKDCDDTLSVLQFANVELLEMRWLDGQLNRSLDEAYHLLSRPRPFWRRMLRPYGRVSARISSLQVDAAVLFENVNNAIKLVGDQYLARVYRRALERFHLAEWDADILRKLDVLRDIHQSLVDRAGAARMEALEWIIILLIAAEIVLSFVR